MNPFNWVEAETINQSSGILCVGDGKTNYVTNILKNCYIRVKGVDFGIGEAKSFTARIASDYDESLPDRYKPILNVRLDSNTGTIIAKVKIPNTGSLNSWQDVCIDLSSVPAGVHDLYFTFSGVSSQTTLFNFDRWRFDTNPSAISNIQSDAKEKNSPAYKLDGTPASGNQPTQTILIKNGKKFIKR